MNFLEDILLSQDKIDSIVRYEKSFGNLWVQKALNAAKAQKYIDDNLEVVHRGEGLSGRCLSSGSITFERKDNGDITDQDIYAILAVERGQENKITKRTEKQATVFWLCDSSD